MTIDHLDNVPDVIDYDANDAGRAQRFVDEYFNVIRYVPAWNQWLTWGEDCWEVEESGQITRLAVEHSRVLYQEALATTGHKQRDVATKMAMQSGNAIRIKAMLSLAQTDARVVVSHKRIDADPWLLGVQNGVIDLRNGTHRRGRQEDLITKQAGTIYIADAQCPRWQQFTGEVFAHDEDLTTYLQKYVGYTLTGSTKEQCLGFAYGAGSNGKSTMFELLLELHNDYGQRAPQSLLTLTQNGKEPVHEIARLHGARFVVGSEVAEGSRLAECRVKDLTGSDTLTGRFLYSKAFDFVPQFKLFMVGNYKPVIQGGDHGIWRRIRLIPFKEQFSRGNRDERLGEKLSEELPGILNWALEGLRLWHRDGLYPPKVIAEAVAEYQEEEDVLAEFLEEMIKSDLQGHLSRKRMRVLYNHWAEDNRVRRTFSPKGLAKRLRDRGYYEVRRNDGFHWAGITEKS